VDIGLVRGDVQQLIQADLRFLIPPIRPRIRQRREVFIERNKKKIKKKCKSRKIEVIDSGGSVKPGDNRIWYSVVDELMDKATTEEMDAVEAAVNASRSEKDGDATGA